MQNSEVLLVLTTLPPEADADAFARAMIEAGLAACVTKMAAATSIYKWQGQVESATEVPLLIKTTADAYPALERWLNDRHPYDLPEVIALPVSRGLPGYLDWVVQSTGGQAFDKTGSA